MKDLFSNVRGTQKKKKNLKNYRTDKTKIILILLASKKQKKETFHYKYLDCLACGKNFEWKWLPARGSAGGILLGSNLNCFEILSWDLNFF